MNSPFANLYEAIMARIKAQVPAIRYASQELGQLENYNPSTGRPSVTFPCVLIDFDNFAASDLTYGIQDLTGDVIVRIALDTWSSASSLTPADVRAQALNYYDVEWNLYCALHGWSPNPDTAGYLTRTGVQTEKRDDAIRVREMRFRLRFTDTSAEDRRIEITKPPLITNH